MKFVNAHPGSGKTTAAIRVSVDIAIQGKHVVICQPTKELLLQSHNTLNELLIDHPFVSVIRIDTDTTADSDYGVVRTITDVIKSISDKSTEYASGVILLITHEALLGVKSWENKEKWTLFVDEVPNSIQSYNYTFTTNDKMFFESFTVHSYIPDTDYIQIIPSNSWFMNQLAKGTFVINKIAGMFRTNSYTCIVKKSEWVKIRFPTFKTPIPISSLTELVSNGKNKLPIDKISLANINFTFILSSTPFYGFLDVTIMGANSTDSFVSRLFPSIEHNELIISMLRPKTTYEHVHIQYMSDRRNSKNFVQTFDKNKDTFIYAEFERAAKLAITEFGKPYLTVVNTDCTYTDIVATQLPVISHGMNSYTDFNNLVYLATMNLNNDTKHLLNALSPGAAEAYAVDMYESRVYQAIMRLSLRNPDDTTPVEVIVFDKRAADYLAVQLPGCRINKLETAPILPTIVKWENETARKNKLKCLAVEAQHFEEIHGCTPCISILAGVKDTLGVNSNFDISDQFIDTLSDTFKTNKPSSKDSNSLYSPAKFIGGRTEESIAYMTGIILDHDKGMLTPNEFMSKLPGVKMAIYSTWSSIGGDRWHVYIPTKQAFSAKAYSTIATRLIKETGLDIGLFDKNAMKAAQIFYAPCQATENENNSFFTRQYGNDLDITNWLIDAKVEISNNVEPIPLVVLEIEQSGSVDIDQAVLVYQNRIPGTSCNERMRLGRKLYMSGMNLPDVRDKLKQTLEPKHQRHINSIIKTLEIT